MAFKPPTFDNNVRLAAFLDNFQRLMPERRWTATIENLAADNPAYRNVGINNDERPLRGLAALAKWRVPSWQPTDQNLTDLLQFDLLIQTHDSVVVSAEKAEGEWRADVVDTESSEDKKILGTATHERPVEALILALNRAAASYARWYSGADALN